MDGFDLELNREICGIIDAGRDKSPVELAAQDGRMSLYTRYNFSLWEASGLLAEVMEEYLLTPDEMMMVVGLGEKILKGGGYVEA